MSTSGLSVHWLVQSCLRSVHPTFNWHIVRGTLGSAPPSLVIDLRGGDMPMGEQTLHLAEKARVGEAVVAIFRRRATASAGLGFDASG